MKYRGLSRQYPDRFDKIQKKLQKQTEQTHQYDGFKRPERPTDDIDPLLGSMRKRHPKPRTPGHKTDNDQANHGIENVERSLYFGGQNIIKNIDIGIAFQGLRMGKGEDHAERNAECADFKRAGERKSNVSAAHVNNGHGRGNSQGDSTEGKKIPIHGLDKFGNLH